jgi:hypothetical protein
LIAEERHEHRHTERLLRAMVRTPVVLEGLLSGVDQGRALAATDGPEGWSVVEVVCHLRDFDGFFQGRVELMLVEEHPMLPAYDHERIALERGYRHDDLGRALATLLEHREGFVALFADLSPDQWARTGIHPEMGPISVLDAATQLVLHDVDHTEQITRCLGLAERLPIG